MNDGTFSPGRILAQWACMEGLCSVGCLFSNRTSPFLMCRLTWTKDGGHSSATPPSSGLENYTPRCDSTGTHNLHGHLVGAGGRREQLLGHGLPLGQVTGRQDGPAAVLADHHGRSRVDVGPVQHRLPQFLHVPGCDGLRVGQLGGKHLQGAPKTPGAVRSCFFPTGSERRRGFR